MYLTQPQLLITDAQCPKCGQFVPGHRQGAAYCLVCGAAIMVRCHICDAPNSIDHKYCAQCGTQLPEPEP